MSQSQTQVFDAVIVGAGISGAMIAWQLGLKGKRVLIMEAGDPLPPNVNDYMQRFYLATAKVPEIPYTPALMDSTGLVDPGTMNAPRPTVLTLGDNWKDPKQAYLDQVGKLPFASTYERVSGGTMRHWLGTSLRFVPHDFTMKTTYGRLVDWPIGYNELERWYGDAEHAIGVSANKADQAYHGIAFPPDYNYPMPQIPLSLVDQAVAAKVDGMELDGEALTVTSTPAGRNSQPYDNRRVCAGNTNCIPICPIQAKYDPSVTLNKALDTGNVVIWGNTVASNVAVDGTGQVRQIDYIQYATAGGPATARGCVTAKVFILAAHAIETPKLLLMSKNEGRTPNGVANSSDLVGRNLMDHPIYLAWAQMPQPVFGYRGPLSTAGIETLRDGIFRKDRAAFRIEIGNEGWNFPIGDPYTTVMDLINGGNVSRLNPGGKALSGQALTSAMNAALSRQFRLGFLVEQSPEPGNRVTLSDRVDHLGLPRPRVTYDISDYTKQGFVAAKRAADAIFAKLGAKQFTAVAPGPAQFTFEGETFGYFGAGHIVGTYRMGGNKTDSVVDANQRSWDHPNLYLVGSGTFPTVATGNPTLTIAALALRTADAILASGL
ncbi:GMC family oxidoreductase [Acidisphaera sp. S103]|uniref:GMC family oxidoreductase n=1 Tax=Acidisphaera sp. S103 TaxID=1747223 RepID=UPI00131C5D50|nr:GMC family oxidoreductase [Acidisphaera sp. S103]